MMGMTQDLREGSGSDGNDPGSDGKDPGSDGNDPGSDGNDPGSDGVEERIGVLDPGSDAKLRDLMW
jgi:hypothetical protein